MDVQVEAKSKRKSDVRELGVQVRPGQVKARPGGSQARWKPGQVEARPSGSWVWKCAGVAGPYWCRWIILGCHWAMLVSLNHVGMLLAMLVVC